MKFKLLFSGLLLVLFQTMESQEKKDSVLRFSLAEAKAYAIQNSYSVQTAAIDLEVAKKKIFETTAIGLPQVTGQAQYQNIFKVPELGFPATTYDGVSLSQDNPSITIHDNSVISSGPGIPAPLGVKENVTFDFTVSQLIFSGEYLVGLQAARVFKLYSEQAINRTKNEINENVAKTYCLVLVTSENLKILNQSIDAINKLYEEIKQMNIQGLTESTDVDQIEITKTTIENTFLSLKNQNIIAQKLLKFQMGIDLYNPILLTDSISSVIDAGTNSYLNSITFTLDNNIDYKIMLTQENLSLLSLRREQSKSLPTIAGFYKHQELAKKPAINFNPPDVIGLSLQFPIFSSGMKYAQIKQAKLNLQKTRVLKTQVAQSILMDFSQSKNAYETAYNNYLNQKKNLNLSQRIYNKTLTKYKEGVSSSFELNQIQNQFLTSQSNYFLAIMDLFNAKAKLEKLLSTAQ
jgi:outer membrane protein